MPAVTPDFLRNIRLENHFLWTSSHRSELLQNSLVLRQSISDGGTSERGRSPEVISLSPALEIQKSGFFEEKKRSVSSGLV